MLSHNTSPSLIRLIFIRAYYMHIDHFVVNIDKFSSIVFIQQNEAEGYVQDRAIFASYILKYFIEVQAYVQIYSYGPLNVGTIDIKRKESPP